MVELSVSNLLMRTNVGVEDGHWIGSHGHGSTCQPDDVLQSVSGVVAASRGAVPAAAADDDGCGGGGDVAAVVNAILAPAAVERAANQFREQQSFVTQIVMTTTTPAAAAAVAAATPRLCLASSAPRTDVSHSTPALPQQRTRR